MHQLVYITFLLVCIIDCSNSYQNFRHYTQLITVLEAEKSKSCPDQPITRSCGIDLGTTYSLVSVIENGKPKLLSLNDKFTIPSVITYRGNDVVVGQEAVNARQKYPESTFSSVKRVIGRTYKSARLSGDSFLFGKRLVPLNVAGEREPYCGLLVKSTEQVLRPEEISAELLKRLIDLAKDYYGGEEVKNAVITVPAYFDAAQRAATETAGRLAGLEKVKLLKEPEAAAIAYGLMKKEPQLILVFDLGGGTFDVSVLEVGDGLAEVIATSGDSHLGGDDFDEVIVDFILKSLSEQAEQHIRSNILYFNQVKQAATQAKLHLTKHYNTTISIPSIGLGEDIQIFLTRKKFEGLVQPLLQRVLKPLREVALLAGINLPGETGISPISAKLIGEEEDQNEFENEYQAMERREKVGRLKAKVKQKAEGKIMKELARIRKISGSSVKLFPDGQPIDDVLLVGGATRMPCIINLVRALTGIDPKRYLNPDEAICLGAGVFAGTLDGTVENFEVVSQLKSALLRLIHDENMLSTNSTVIDKEEKTPKKLKIFRNR